MVSSRSLCVSLVLAASVPSCTAWGCDGHQIVGRIADGLISKTTAASVKKILSSRNDFETEDDTSLASVACWADDIKYKDPYSPWSAPLHFIDTPDEACTYEYSRDCKSYLNGEKGACVSGAISNYTSQLTGELKGYNQDEALKFLVHFIGDIHQPLHVAFTSDHGGNAQQTTWFGVRGEVPVQDRPTSGFKDNLHAVWDEDIIYQTEKVEKYTWESYADALAKDISTFQRTTWAKCSSTGTVCPDPWATEGIGYACSNAYYSAPPHRHELTEKLCTDDKPCALAQPYYDTNKDVVSKRLSQAGVRLAATLDKIFAGKGDAGPRIVAHKGPRRVGGASWEA